MNVTGRFHTRYGDAPGRYVHIGVLDYVVNNTVNAANIPSLVSLFVDRGVSVNLRTTKDEVAGITPLDSFNNKYNTRNGNHFMLAADIIRAAGGKCLFLLSDRKRRSRYNIGARLLFAG